MNQASPFLKREKYNFNIIHVSMNQASPFLKREKYNFSIIQVSMNQASPFLKREKYNFNIIQVSMNQASPFLKREKYNFSIIQSDVVVCILILHAPVNKNVLVMSGWSWSQCTPESISAIGSECLFITKTCPCNTQEFFSEEKNENFIRKNVIFLIF